MCFSVCDRLSSLSRNLRHMQFALAIATATTLSLPGQTSAPAYCQQGALGTESGRDAYVFRGDRCEGIYQLRRSGGSDRLKLRSLTSNRSDAALSCQTDLQISWPPLPSSVKLKIAVVPLDSPLLYRMDTEVNGSKGVFRWPAAIACTLFATYRNLGVLASYLTDDRTQVQVACTLELTTGAGARRVRADILSLEPIHRLQVFSRPCNIATDCNSLGSGSVAYTLAAGDRDGTFAVTIDLAGPPGSEFYNLRFSGEIANAANPTVATSVIVRIPPSNTPGGTVK